MSSPAEEEMTDKAMSTFEMTGRKKQIIFVVSIVVGGLLAAFFKEQILSYSDVISKGLGVLSAIIASSMIIILSCTIIFFCRSVAERVEDQIQREKKIAEKIGNSISSYLEKNGLKIIGGQLFRQTIRSIGMKSESSEERIKSAFRFLNKMEKKDAFLQPAISHLFAKSFDITEEKIADLSNLRINYLINAGEQVDLAEQYAKQFGGSIEFIDYENTQKLEKSYSLLFRNYVARICGSDVFKEKTQYIVCDGSFEGYDLSAKPFLKSQIDFMKENGFNVNLAFLDDIGKIEDSVLGWRSELYNGEAVLRIQREAEYDPKKDINITISPPSGDGDFSRFLSEIKRHLKSA